MSYDGDEVPIRPPRRAQTLPVRFAADTGPYPPSVHVTEDYIRSPFISRREPYSPRIIDTEFRPRHSQPRHARETDWATPPTDSQARFAPPAERYRNHTYHRRDSYQKSRLGSDNDSDEASVIGERSPERLYRPTIITERSRDYERDDSVLTELVTKERLRRIRNRSVNPYQGDYSPTDSESEQADHYTGYSFSLSRHTRSPLSEDETLGSVSEPSEKDPKTPEPQSFEKVAPAGKVYGVLRSRYTGDGIIGGLQTAKLTFIRDATSGIRKGPSPIFRWVHFEDNSMNFDGFQNDVDHIPGLTDAERNGISKLLIRARKRFDKPVQTSHRVKARFMVPSFLQEIISSEVRPKVPKSRTITWLCLPYFCLEKYSELLAGSGPSSHPMRTLLQARFSMVQKERDMQQAVCQLDDAQPDNCFHIAQLWCLVLEDSLLVTCARVPLSVLQGESISVNNGPSPSNGEPRSPFLLVSGGRSLLWSFPVDECLSWFAFISHFGEYWPKKIEYMYNGKSITLDDWPRIIAIAKRSSVRINLEFRSSSEKLSRKILAGYEDSTVPVDNGNAPILSQDVEAIPNLPTESTVKTASGTINDQPETYNAKDPLSWQPEKSRERDTSPHKSEARASPDPGMSLLGHDFHVFTWLNVSSWPNTKRTLKSMSKGDKSTIKDQKSDTSPAEAEECDSITLMINENHIKEDLMEMDQFLAHMTKLNQRLAYQGCINRTRQDIYDMLTKERHELNSSTGKSYKRRKSYENKVDLMNAADLMFRFFLPFNLVVPTVGKYWGALFQLVSSASRQPKNRQNLSEDGPELEHGLSSLSPRENDEACAEARLWLEMITRRTERFGEFCSQAPSVDRVKLRLPEELPKAWLHLLMSLIVCTNDRMLFEDQMTTCYELLEEGMCKVVRGLTSKSLLEYTVFIPFEVASLVNFQILQDITRNAPDISETYWQYLRRLESDIEANPLDRGHQNQITLLKQEISVIGETLRQQKRILDSIQMVDRGRSTDAKVSKERLYIEGQGRRADHHYGSRRDIEPIHYEPDPDGRVARATANTYVSNYDVPIVIESLQSPVSQLSPTDPSGVQGLLNQDSQALVDKRIRDFREINDRASDLETWNIQKIDSNKDRQEAAIYAFTIVTIIFLPLSAVAGIMGMNTSDIRNMESNQWVYWAVALPLTFIIISICLALAGELQNFRSMFAKFWSGGKRGKPGYTAIPETYNIIEPRSILIPSSRTRTLSPPPRAAPSYYYENRRRHRSADRDYV